MPNETPTLVAIRAAHHAEATPIYDRVVFEFRGALPPMRLEYVPQLISDGSGLPVRLAGRAIVLVQFSPALAHNDTGATAPGRMTLKLPLVREIAQAGDFEAVVTYGIGLRRRAVTRILTMENASRLVIDFM